MDLVEYRQRGKQMIDYIANYLDTVHKRRVIPNVPLRYLIDALPESAPMHGEDYNEIIEDIDKHIMPGITHWLSPQMHGYYPAPISFPSLLGEMLANGMNCVSFTWDSSPACTELEMVVVNWLAKMMGLPDHFLHHHESSGGGVIQATASESTLVALLAARTNAVDRLRELYVECDEGEICTRLVAYCSNQAHSSLFKGSKIVLVRMRSIKTDENGCILIEELITTIEDDIAKGLHPFWVCATLGTTGTCAFDDLEEISGICHKYKLLLHADAAYAGNAFICPEFRRKGIEYADTIVVNPTKWLMINLDAAILWVNNKSDVCRTFSVNFSIFADDNIKGKINFMDWQIPLSRRFRALKIWFVLRSYGVVGLQKYIRDSVLLARKFESLLLTDGRFETVCENSMGLVTFRLKGSDEINKKFLQQLTRRRQIFCTSYDFNGTLVLRYTVDASLNREEHLPNDFSEMCKVADIIMENGKI